MELTDKQKEIVNYDQLGTLIVKGTAGSGKSLVGLHRINYLFDKKNNSSFADKETCNVLVITFNKVMFYQLKENFEEIKNDNTKNGNICFINIDKIMYRESKHFIGEQYTIIMGDYKIKTIINFLNTKKDKYSTEFLLDEFKWIRNNLINKRQDYLTVIRLGRGKRKLNKDDRNYIWDLLQSYREKMLKNKEIDYLDACILTLKKGNLDLFKKYNHIIVDEAQDLSKLKLMFITKLNNYNLQKTENSLMILYDSSQNVYDESWLGYGRSFASIGLEVRNKIKKLETSYRTTRQIHQAANNLISAFKEENVDKETEIKPVFAGSEEGIKPIVFKFENKNEEYNTYVEIIEQLTNKTYLYKDIMIVSFIKNNLEDIENVFKENGIPSYILDGDKIENAKNENVNLNENKIKLLTVNNAKGLESKIVFIANTNSLNFINQNEEKDEEEFVIRNSKKLYTAMTRAQELLFMAEDEIYINKIDEKYLTKINDCKNIDIDSYISSDLKEHNILIEGNKTNRFNDIIAEYKKQAEEQETIRMNNEIRIQRELYNNSLKQNSKNELKEQIENKFKTLDAEIINFIAEAETLYNLFKKNSITASIVYVAYSKILENMIRDFIEDLNQGYSTKITFGTLVGHIRKFKLLKEICHDFDSMKIIQNRNDATHSALNDDSQVEKIRKYLIEDNGIIKLERAIKEELAKAIETNKSKEIVKEGDLIGNYSIVKVNKKEYYSYLINNDDLVVSRNKIPLGKYKLTGHYTKSRGLEIYVIDNFVRV